MHDVGRLFAHWRRTPPLRMLVAGIATALGMKLPDPIDAQPKKYMTEKEFARMIAITGGRMD